jgi:hypothetical protein
MIIPMPAVLVATYNDDVLPHAAVRGRGSAR